MLQTNKLKKNQWLEVILLLGPKINLIHSRDPSENVSKFHSLVEHLLRHKGDAFTISRMKTYRLAIQQYCLEQEVTPIPFCKTDKDGFPKAIAFLKPDRKHVNSMRYSLSFIRLCEEFKLAPKYSTDTIILPSTANEELVEDIVSFVKTWDGIKFVPQLKPGNLVLSNKAGPNGPATISCLQDLAALRAPGNGKLLSSIQELLKISISWMDLNKYNTDDVLDKPKHSKLCLLQDKAGKTRIIAIADWFTNIALSPIHNSFMEGLRCLKGDVTYLQDKIPDLVQGLGSYLYSSDMTAFTDRFPIRLEEAVIEAAFGASISSLWKTILTEREFHHQLGGVTYSCGNPMGVLSSWPVSTYTHHAVKAYCVHKCGLDVKKYKYLILGDDTLDSDLGVYNKYLEVIQGLGVSISTQKCTRSENSKAEFAKRLFTPDGEITGIPITLLKGVDRYPEQFLELYRICISRGYSSEYLTTGFSALISKHKSAKMLADILSLPEHVTKLKPLWEPKPDTWASHFVGLDEVQQDKLVKLSRESLFWSIVNNIDSVAKENRTSKYELKPTHPLIFALSNAIERYLPEEAYTSDFEEDELYIYNKWMEGEYIHLVNIPSVNTYRYHNRGHRVTKCNFDVFTRLLQLCGGNANIPLHPRTIYTNQDLYDIALGRISPL